MELVYLWVEEYKNIRNQGFNFSPRFECEFKPKYNRDGKLEDDSELEIIPKEYIENFFAENINVTAIVGENGSGKSSILEILLDIFAGSNNNEPKKGYICLYYGDKLEAYTNICQIKYLNNNKIKDLHEYCYPESILSNEHNLIAVHINNQFHRIKQRVSEELYIEDSQIDDYEIKNILIKNYMGNKSNYLKISEKFFIPKKVFILFENDSFSENNLYEDNIFYEETIWKEISDKIKSLKENNFFEKLKIVQEIFDLKREKHKKDIVNINFIDTIFGRAGTDEYFKAKYKFNINLEENTPEKIKISTSNEDRFEFEMSEIDSNIKSFINKLPYVFKVDIQDDTKSFQHLSYGERQLLVQLNFILYRSKQKEYPTNNEPQDIENIIIFLDEFELGLHPNWQKKAIGYLVDFLKIIDKKFHIIITSHSPFILSDIPKENVIFLNKIDEKIKERYPILDIKDLKNGNCVNVSKHKELQTFGANIHTLLSDGFFMRDGLMGEFAKSKITEILDFLNDKEKLKTIQKEQIKPIIESIGEDFLRNKLLNLYRNKLTKDEKEKEKQILKNRIDELQRQYDGLNK